MKKLNQFDTLAAAFEKAEVGRFLETELVPLRNVGKVRVTYNWLYSALNCDPNDGSSFVWLIDKLPNGKMSLSPKNKYANMQLYTSIRPDWSYFAQVQAPHRADWIMQVQGDEELGFEAGDLNVVSFKGLNNQYLSVNPSVTSHDDHAGYKIQSHSMVLDSSTKWFMAITQVHQTNINLALKSDFSMDDLKEVLSQNGLESSADELNRFYKTLS